MTFENYVKSCKQFAAETAEWGGIEPSQYYTTVDPYGWDETCDNAHGGLHIEWAFHMDERKIDKYADDEYIKQIANNAQQLIDEDGDLQQWQAFIKKYS